MTKLESTCADVFPHDFLSFFLSFNDRNEPVKRMHFPNSRCDAVPIQKKVGLLQKVTMFENSQITGLNRSVDETVLSGFQTA